MRRLRGLRRRLGLSPRIGGDVNGIVIAGGNGAYVVITTVDGQPATENMAIETQKPTIAGYIVNTAGIVSGVTLAFSRNGTADGTTVTDEAGHFTYTFTGSLVDQTANSIGVTADMPSTPSGAFTVNVTTPVQFIASAADINSIPVMPTHQTGDLLIAFAYRDGGTAITVPAGWNTALAPTPINTNCAVIAWKYAASNAEVSGTWTNATNLIIACYRGADLVDPIGAASAANFTSGVLSYPSLTLEEPSTSIVLCFVGSRVSTTAVETPPAGTINRVSYTNTTAASKAALHDTNSPVSTWSSLTSINSGGQTHITASLELLT